MRYSARFGLRNILVLFNGKAFSHHHSLQHTVDIPVSSPFANYEHRRLDLPAHIYSYHCSVCKVGLGHLRFMIVVTKHKKNYWKYNGVLFVASSEVVH